MPRRTREPTVSGRTFDHCPLILCRRVLLIRRHPGPEGEPGRISIRIVEDDSFEHSISRRTSRLLRQPHSRCRNLRPQGLLQFIFVLLRAMLDECIVGYHLRLRVALVVTVLYAGWRAGRAVKRMQIARYEQVVLQALPLARPSW